MQNPIPRHITIKDVGDIWLMAKANSLAAQLAELADHARLGIVPTQDIDPCAEHYDARASFKARRIQEARSQIETQHMEKDNECRTFSYAASERN